MIIVESPLRLAALVLGMLSTASFFTTPATSLLSTVFGALTLVIALGESRVMILMSLAQISVCIASLYYFGEALLFGYPSSLATGVVLSLVSLVAVYVESKLLVLRDRLGIPGVVVVVAIFVVLFFTYSRSLPAIGDLMREQLYGTIELISYGGLLYIGASLPYSSAILFGLVYFIYDLLRSVRLKEAV